MGDYLGLLKDLRSEFCVIRFSHFAHFCYNYKFTNFVLKDLHVAGCRDMKISGFLTNAAESFFHYPSIVIYSKKKTLSKLDK